MRQITTKEAGHSNAILARIRDGFSHIIQKVVRDLHEKRILDDTQDGSGFSVTAEFEGARYILIKVSAGEIAPLSARERQVADLALKDLSNAEIAGTLHLDPATVATYFRRIYSKLGVSSRVGLAVRLLGLGQIRVH